MNVFAMMEDPKSSLVSDGGSEDSSVASADRRATLKIKDETIRRRAETQIAGSAGTIATVTSESRTRRRQRRYRPGTVSSLNPAFAVALNENATVYEAAAYMAAKRTDAVLVTNDENLLSGIVTDKDITYRCLAEGLNPSDTPVSRIMTPNPVSVSAQASATDALNKMVAGHFRHLPVVDNEDDYADNGDYDGNSSGGVVGILDITKCLYNALEKLEVAFESSQQLDPAVENRSALSDDSMVEVAQYAEYLKQQLASPDLAGMLSQQSTSPPVVGLHASVMEAARKMKVTRETAVLVFNMDTMPSGLGQLAGIFTTKDLVLRVVAAKNEPSSTPVLRVMTPRPDCVSPETPVLDALRKMHTGKYLHLPVVDDSGMVEGLVDVLKLTYSTLDQCDTDRWGWASVEHFLGHCVRTRARRRRRSHPSTTTR
ncbi:hypothetical protein BJ742DRAFT_551735 [Cladochytrium replicatum]|nr:hypothetical protein BJ742DRAFT_551735 [Cladochytrium replicatum]